MKNEIWKDISGYEQLYSISNYGRVRDNVNRCIKKTHKTSGYERVSLSDVNKIQRLYYIHRLVALHFVPNEGNKPQVHHIDEIKTNNKADNLQWVTSKEHSKLRSDESKAKSKETYKRNKSLEKNVAFNGTTKR